MYPYVLNILSNQAYTSCCCKTKCQLMVWTSCLFSCRGADCTIAAAQKNTFFNKEVIVTASITVPFVILSYLCCTSSPFNTLFFPTPGRESMKTFLPTGLYFYWYTFKGSWTLIRIFFFNAHRTLEAWMKLFKRCCKVAANFKEAWTNGQLIE